MMSIVKFLLLVILLLVAPRVRAETVNFFIVQPGGEGDTESAQPYLAEFFSYLGEKTKLTIGGQYINDANEALSLFKAKRVSLAIVSPEFYEKYKEQFKLKQVLATIPSYSAGAFEKYHIVAHTGTDLSLLTENETTLSLISSQDLSADFLQEKILGDSLLLKRPRWLLQHTDNMLAEIRKVSAGSSSALILLTGYEFSVITELKKTRPEFQGISLVFSSAELPSSTLVTVGSTMAPLKPITEALLTMHESLKGSIALKNLRLKGFATLP